jgi:hypothetical protein
MADSSCFVTGGDTLPVWHLDAEEVGGVHSIG